MRVYSLVTPTHAVLLEQWLRPTLPADMELILETHLQDCPTGCFEQEGWLDCMEKKIRLVLRAIRECDGSVFVHADVDVQFFRPIADELAELMEGHDLLFQLDHPKGAVCAGFFACRASPRVHAFFTEVLRRLEKRDGRNDQTTINRLLRKRRWTRRIRWGVLPSAYFGGGSFTGGTWTPQVRIPIPWRPAMHHANWVVGLEAKISQLEAVRMRITQPRTLAPIALFAYARPGHLAKTLSALGRCEGADRTELFVFSDGPKGDQDRAAVGAVRQQLEQIDGFAAVHRRYRDRNRGLAASIIAGVDEVLERFDRVIVFEDDLIASPHVLGYFNEALDRYEDEARVFSISGYNHPPVVMPVPSQYPFDAYFNPRNSSWGWGTWRDRWRKADWQVTAFETFQRDPAAQSRFNAGGADLSGMLAAQMRGEIDSWSIRWTFAHFEHEALSLCPVRSYIDNIGLDGSGVHSGEAPLLANDLGRSRKSIRFPGTVAVDDRLMGSFRNAYDRRDRSLLRRMRKRLRRWRRGRRGG